MRVISATWEPTAAGASVRELALWSIMSSIPPMLCNEGWWLVGKKGAKLHHGRERQELGVSAARTYNTPGRVSSHVGLME